MTRRVLPSILVGLLAMFAAGTSFPRNIPDGLYFGQESPGMIPEVFAPDIISLADRYEYSVVFSPDLDECVFGVTNMYWSTFTLMFTSMDTDSSWAEPAEAPFLGTGDGLMAEYSGDGERVCFSSSRPAYPPANLWQASRNGGGWDDPVMMDSPVSSTADEFGPTYTADDVLYFVSSRSGGLGSGDLYVAVPVQGQYTTAENLGPPVNTSSNDGSPFIAADESYLIFESDRPGGFGQSDLYISFLSEGVWSEPENLGPVINTEQIEDEPFISPEGQYLFFNRREGWVTSVPTDLYWVDARSVIGLSSVQPSETNAVLRGSWLDQNVPNPFNPSTRISYRIPSGGFVAIRIHDVLGREARSLVNRFQSAGVHSVLLRTTPTDGMPSGVYYYQLLVEGEPLMTRKMLLLK